MLHKLDFIQIKKHYDLREQTHLRILNLFNSKNINDYLELALGISQESGNYSASEYNLGIAVLNNNSQNSVFNLARDIFNCEKITHLPKIIHDRNLAYIKISVGTEMGTMLRPNEIWVGNKRTILSHLIIKHDWDVQNAIEELELYKDNDRASEMDYMVWRDIYLSLDTSLEELIMNANIEANKQGVEIGRLKFLWADAIASELYSQRENL